MKQKHRVITLLLSFLIVGAGVALLILPLAFTQTPQSDQNPGEPPDQSADASPDLSAHLPEVQELLETTYLGRAKEFPDPGEPAVVLRKYLEQNAHEYHERLAGQGQKLDAALAAWQALVQLYPQSRHALVALAKHHRTKAKAAGDIGHTYQASDAYIRAAEIGLEHGHIRYTREIAGLLVELNDKTRLDEIFGRMLAQPKDLDRNPYYLALVDYADALAQLNDDRAWGYFEEAIDFHPENNLEAINYYARHLLDQGQAQKAFEVLDTHLTSEQRVRFVLPAFLRKQAMELLGMDTASAKAEIDMLKQRLGQGPLAGAAFTDQAPLSVAGKSLATDTQAAAASSDSLLSWLRRALKRLTRGTEATAASGTPDPRVSTIFAVKANNTIWKAPIFSANSSRGLWVQVAGSAKKIATLKWLNGNAGLVRIGTDNQVYYRHFTSSTRQWSSWTPLGVPPNGIIATDIAAVAYPSGQADIFVVGNGTDIYNNHATGSTGAWGAWGNWGCCGRLGLEITAAAMPNGTAFVAVKDPADNRAWVRYFTGSLWIPSWEFLDGPPKPTGGSGLVDDISLLAFSNNTVRLFAIASNVIWFRDSSGPWGPWSAFLSSYNKISSFNTQEGADPYGGAYLLSLSNSLYTSRFNGSSWESVGPQGTDTWIAAAGVNVDEDPPYEHTDANDDCRAHGPTPVYTKCYPTAGFCSDFFAQAINLAEVFYNEARGETVGAIDMVGWTVRDRAFQGMKGKRSDGTICDSTTDSGCSACDSYLGGIKWHGTCSALPCNQSTPDFCTNNLTRWYCCALHGGTTQWGTSQSQFNDEHVDTNILHDKGFLWEAVFLMSNYIPEVSTGYIPPGASNCTSVCGDSTKINTEPPYFKEGPGCERVPDPGLDAFITASPEGPMEYLAYDYCAPVAEGSPLPLSSCKWYAADFCGNTPPIQLVPHSACGQYSRAQSQGDNFFWNRVKP